MTLDSKFLVGDTLIDQQHDQLFDSLERITALREHHLSDEAVVDQLSRLNDLIIQHFACEETLMKQIGLPARQLLEHQAEHLRILEELTQIHLNIMAGRQHRVADVLVQVKNWIATHIVEFDLDIQPYIAKPMH